MEVVVVALAHNLLHWISLDQMIGTICNLLVHELELPVFGVASVVVGEWLLDVLDRWRVEEVKWLNSFCFRGLWDTCVL